MSKKLLRISLILVAIGFLLSLVSLVFLNGDIDRIVNLYNQDSLYEEKLFLSEENEIKFLNLDLINRNTVFEKSSDENISIKYFNSEYDKIEITESVDQIKVNNIVKNRFFNFFRWTSKNKSTVIIYVPKSLSIDITLKTTNGNVEVSGIKNLENSVFSSTNGNLTLKDISANKIIFNTTNGKINIENLVSNEFDASTTNGSIRLINIDSKSIKTSTTNGSITIEVHGNPNYYTLSTSTTNGRIRYNDFVLANGKHQVGGIYSILARTTNGNITITIKE